MGDSYTAGPGAGDLDPSNSGDCVRSVGSYGPQLQNDWIYTGASQLSFLACTGAVTDDVLNTQIPEVSSDPPPDLVLITIGGNDIGFSKIAKACLVGLIGSGNCDDKIQQYVQCFLAPPPEQILFARIDLLLSHALNICSQSERHLQ